MKKAPLLLLLIWVVIQSYAQSPCLIYRSSPPITFNHIHDKVIRGLATANITLNNCYNIVIVNCKVGPNNGMGIQLYKCKNIRVDSCYLDSVNTGVYALESTGILVTACQGKNMQMGRPRGQFIQFNEVTGPGNGVQNCRFEEIAGESNQEDAISIFKSSGTADSPILITGNWIRGGGPSKTGGGIMLGDTGGDYQIARDNILVNPGQYGMAIAGGHHNEIINNKIYSKQQSFTNVGLYIWAQAGAACGLNTISGNQVNWKMHTGENNGSWNNGNCGPVTGWTDNTWNAKIDESILPQQIITLCTIVSNR
ncbi:MAG: right-handed parallel beta-helix repeat-containing protein [Mucilaginibacter sp.]